MSTLKKSNPWTGEVLFETPQAGVAEFLQSLQQAKQAQDLFKKTSLDQRADLLRKWAEIMAEEKSEIAKAVATEQGLPLSFVTNEVVDAAQKSIENLSLDVRLFPKPETLQPTGVIGMSIAWPMAYLWISQYVAQALAAGNGVILKVPSLAPISAKIIFDTLNRLDLPEGLVQFLFGSGQELNPLLAGHPGLQGFLFQGHHSHSAGLVEATALRRKKAQFFLGGKNSSLVHGDFDFEKQMEDILRPALLGQGQLGVNTHRIFITQAHEKRFFEVVQSYLEKLKPSEGPLDSSLWTPMISSEKQKAFAANLPQISADQGKIFSRGSDHKLFSFPTFTQDMSNCSELQQDEVRGPLFVVTAVKYVHEMVKWTNTGYLGQSAIFWGPQEKAQSLLAQLQVGQGLNQKWGDFLSWQIPQKQSFYGIPSVKWSGAFYSDVKSLT